MSLVRKILEKKGATVYSVAEDASVLDAARMMNEHRIGALVVASGDKVIGIFTERDILCRVVAGQKDPAQTRVKDVMTTPVAVCAPQTTRDECRAVMRQRRLRHLPVVDEGRLMGIISIGDVTDADQADQEQTIEYLTEYLLGEWK